MSSHIKIARMRMGLTQEQAAKKLGIHPTTLNKYESGARIPSGKVLKAMSTLFDANLNALIDLSTPLGKEDNEMLRKENAELKGELLKMYRENYNLRVAMEKEQKKAGMTHKAVNGE